ncbi:MAG TPA: alpha-ketoglutarate-dependent dioxygenase AlkB, partial [Gammaproteobacteria bacterium]
MLMLLSEPHYYRLQEAELIYFPQIFAADEGARLLQQLQQTVHWTGRSLRLYGKEIAMPRLIAWYADPGIRYSYSGQTAEHNDWTPELQAIKPRIESLANARFNSALLNYYRNGAD